MGIDGTVNPINWRPGSELDVSIKGDELGGSEKIWGAKLNALSPLELTGKIESSENYISIPRFRLRGGPNHLEGSARFDQQPPRLSADLRSDSLDLTPLIEDLASTELVGSQFEIGWLWAEDAIADVTLRVKRLAAGDHVIDALKGRLTLADSVLKIDPLAGAYQSDGSREGRDRSVPLRLAGTIRPIDEDVSRQDKVRADLDLTSGDLNVSLAGVANLSGLDGTLLQMRAAAANLQALSMASSVDLNTFAPVELTATVRGEDRFISVDNLTITAQDHDISGNVTLKLSSNKPSIEVDLASRTINVDDFRPTAEVHELLENDSPAPEDRNKVFSDEPFNLSWLDKFDLDLEARIDTFVINQTTFRNARAETRLRDGVLTISPLTADLAEGGVDGLLSIHQNGEFAELISRFAARNLSPADLGKRGEGILDGGITNLSFVIDAKGNSPSDLAASLNGEITIQIEEATIRNDTFELFGSDLFMESLTMINPFIESDEHTQLECAAVRFVAKDGTLTTSEQVAIQTNKVKIVGSGIINLKTEELEIGLTPVARTGIGLNVGSLVKFARLGGTLNDPRVEGDPVGYLKTGAAIGAAISTAGVSLLVDGLFKRVTGGGSVCERASEKETADPAPMNGQTASQ